MPGTADGTWHGGNRAGGIVGGAWPDGIGAFLGILAGITFGERTAVLRPLGDVYAMMLLSVVYPYILSSLIVGLGSLVAGRARRLLHASWRIYLLLWVT